jgi:hypothetical protein
MLDTVPDRSGDLVYSAPNEVKSSATSHVSQIPLILRRLPFPAPSARRTPAATHSANLRCSDRRLTVAASDRVNSSMERPVTARSSSAVTRCSRSWGNCLGIFWRKYQLCAKEVPGLAHKSICAPIEVQYAPHTTRRNRRSWQLNVIGPLDYAAFPS